LPFRHLILFLFSTVLIFVNKSSVFFEINSHCTTFLPISYGMGIVTAPFNGMLDFLPRIRTWWNALLVFLFGGKPTNRLFLIGWDAHLRMLGEESVTYFPTTSCLVCQEQKKGVRQSSSAFVFLASISFDEVGILNSIGSRSRVLEKTQLATEDITGGGSNLNVGADATALGQVY